MVLFADKIVKKTDQQSRSATQCRYKPSNNSNGLLQVKFLQSI